MKSLPLRYDFDEQLRINLLGISSIFRVPAYFTSWKTTGKTHASCSISSFLNISLNNEENDK